MKRHDYDECPFCMAGYICEDSTAHPSAEHDRQKAKALDWLTLPLVVIVVFVICMVAA